ncbi:MAG: DedA family protein [bacterium]|nr:DedA family protein [bacterium]
MTIESSFVPFPSELIIPPAAYLASQGKMDVYLVILFGTLGSLLGALINYYLAMSLGRPVVYSLVKRKWAKYLLLNEKKVEKSEKYFLKYGGLSTFLGRLIPAVRQVISLPAGFTRMKLKPFLFYTTLGAGIWVCVLAALGYFFGANEELIRQYSHQIGFYVLFAILLSLVIVFLFRKWRRS